ncbi:MAG: oligosaccharide flippase family protein [Anaerolineae bacterium]|nr:oligosaccharide flippase family protein [Anaerolineae bacterium]
MLDSLKTRYLETAKHALIFGLGNMATKALGFLLLPLYTSFLSPAQYGALAIVNVTSSLLAILLGMGLRTALFKYYFVSEEREFKRIVMSSALFWLLGVGILALCILWPTAPLLAQSLLGDHSRSIYFQLMAVTLVFSGLRTVPFAIFRAEKKSTQYVLFSIASFLLATSLNIYFIVRLHMGVIGILSASLITSAVSALAGIIVCRKYLAWRFSWHVMKDILKFGLPLVPAGLGSFFLIQSDRYFLKFLSTMSQVGLYSLGLQFGMVINLFFVQPFQLIWLPTAFEMQHRPNAKTFYGGILTYFVLIASWAALGVSLLSKEAIAIMTTPKYHPAHAIVPWISFAYVFYGAYMVVNIGIYLRERTSLAGWLVGASALANMGLNLLLIPRIAGQGAALATFAAYALLFVISLGVNRRIYPVSYEWNRLGKLAIITLLLLIAGKALSTGLFLSLAIKGLLLLGFWPILYLFKFFKPEELSASKRVIAQLWKRIRHKEATI